MAPRFSALARACNCNCQVSPPFALTFNSCSTWHTHTHTHSPTPVAPQYLSIAHIIYYPSAPYLSQRIQSLLSVSDKCSCSSDWLRADCGSTLRLGGSSPSALRLDIEMFHAIMKTSLLASSLHKFKSQPVFRLRIAPRQCSETFLFILQFNGWFDGKKE